MDIRRITQKEIGELNCIITPKFGWCYTIESANATDDDTYCIVFSDYNKANDEKTQKEVGKIVKKMFGAKAVYCFGTKLA